jgi:hypothetical protein
MKRRLVIILVLLITSSEIIFAQCAMCRSTIENNYSNGDPGIAAGINTGILYLLSMPYLAIIIIGYLWYKSSKNASKKLSDSVTAR